MVDLVIVGSLALDSVETPFGRARDVVGGAATYASYAASFFSKPGIVGVVGKDFPEKYLAILEKRGVSLAGVKVSGKTFRWHGSYSYDMNEAKTIKTELNSFAGFKPLIPPAYRNAPYVFLANIDPELQLSVLNQIKKPKLVAVDTMNYWIERKRDKLLQVISKADLLMLNDGEARELFSTPSLVRAARHALELGPRHVVVKKGEHGALLFSKGKSGVSHFSAPGYPLEDVRDPTGSGDCFAGAAIGYMAGKKALGEPELRKAIIYGSVIASFNAEDFSLNRVMKLGSGEIEKRYREFRNMRAF